jgi:diguanylate cyclase (GGDEF)-like protein/PAS domain S-box-containing protein
MLLEQQHYAAESHSTFHLINGLIFVILTALLLYLLVHRYATDLFCSRKLVQQVFEASPNGIAVIRDQDQKILLTNQQFATLSGYTAETLPGRTDGDLKLWENSEERFAFLRRIRDEGTILGFEATFRHRDGTGFPGSISARQINFDGQSCTITFIDDITHQKQVSRQVEELTRYDAMTGLPNQKLLTERLNQLLTINSRDEQGLSVLTLALGRCPGSISARGHDGCDELLRCVAQRLRSVLRETDTLAVLQKGEFAIIFPRAESERDLLPAVTKLLDCINEPIKLDEAEFQLHAHIGVAVFPCDGRTSDVLLQHAHLAMTQAQTCIGESFFRFYAEEMNRLAEEQLQVEASILRGIKAGEFFLCYQPLFDQTG